MRKLDFSGYCVRDSQVLGAEIPCSDQMNFASDHLPEKNTMHQ